MSDPSEKAETLLITGASGHLGRRVLANLLDTLGIAPSRLIAVTRDPAKLADIAARGVEVRRGDFDEPASLASAFSGADRVLLISTDTLDRPGARIAQHKAAIAAAKDAGVKHIVYTSMPRPEGSPIPFAPDHLGTEEALAASGLGWTVLRNAWYFENLALSLPNALAAGKWYTSAGDGRSAYLAREDCARAAAYVLAGPLATNAIIDITGSTAVTNAEIAAAVREAYVRPLEVVAVSDEELVGGIIAAGLPEPIARIFASFDTATRVGNFATATDAVEKLTGTPPQTLAAFLAANKNLFLPQEATRATA
ncbi:SDR family oxidoreductase [Hyphomicrobium sp. CS1GBMeth3]|uniref:SDR family oxidoreductase n=1 Tax=Hyphomicrobium sp. CS1GBMeth3 TaxID=1892845 RepID=UPI00093091CE|nr:SDR family oxidoreductase [Hyphomicrobium sp. CS1GBMeth3]